MQNYSLDSLFPKPLYCVDNFLLENLDAFEQGIDRVTLTHGTYSSAALGVNSTHQTNQQIHTEPEFAPLVIALQDHIMEFARIIGHEARKAFLFNINSMWANTSDQGGYNFPHTHPGGVIAGAYYVRVDSPDATITFFNQHDPILTPKEPSPYSNTKMTYPCLPGRLFLFKGDFVHGNFPQPTPGVKKVISFNVS